ncbi:hypothetical protein VP1G_03069 [Cytospora mali]|uniref:aldehyde dehydrogenase (NAD(+)) n=1 Tax=Cytospora mali TaxID=578113 RepID=A0A194UVD7_CYTMA|nr:hypothetical protein VP1G_03069 [Valsa mali var. pyri (nom. inval.)]
MATPAVDQLAFDYFPGNIINNELVDTETTRHSIDPSTGQPLYEVPVADKDDLDLAVKFAKAAFKKWSKTSFDDRAKLLIAFSDAIEKYREEFEILSTKESGKPIAVAKVEIGLTIDFLHAFAKMEIKDEVLEEDDERTIYQTWMPLGVCAGIVPWNWPVLLAVVKIAQALITGNCFVVKPSPYTPYCDLKLGEIAMDIFPPGVLQVLSGDDSLGPLLTEHPGIDMVSFTGSIRTGSLVAQSCSKTLKRFVLELGGNDAAIVCEDVDIAKCVPMLASSAFYQSGQICMDVKRIYIYEKIYDEFRDAMVQFTKDNIKTGDAFGQDTFVGPLQNKMQLDLVKGMYEDIQSCGWKTALEGKVHHDKSGYYVEPAIIDNPPDDSRIVVEEPFGPIVPLLKWSDEEDVITRANSSNTGLGASVWSKDVAKAEKIARELSAGSVWVNAHFQVSPNVPFGGHKQSGFGTELGVSGLKQYMNPRSLWVFKKTF